MGDRANVRGWMRTYSATVSSNSASVQDGFTTLVLPKGAFVMINRKWLVTYAFGCGLFLAADAIWALCFYCGFESPDLHTDPASPQAGLPFDLFATAGPCETFLAQPPLAVERDGALIRIVVATAVSANCGFGRQTRSWEVGPFAAGTYQIELYAFDEEWDPDTRFFVGELPLQVTPASGVPQPAVIPTMGVFAGGLLAVLVGLLGWSAVARPRVGG